MTHKNIIDNFFYFDSNTLYKVNSFFTGYTLYNGKEYNSNEAFIQSIPSDAWEGCFVELKNNSDTITIRQDFNGCWGIYIFKANNIFAISNSFWLLVNKIKDKYSLTVNEKFAKSMFVFDLCTLY